MADHRRSRGPAGALCLVYDRGSVPDAHERSIPEGDHGAERGYHRSIRSLGYLCRDTYPAHPRSHHLPRLPRGLMKSVL